MWVYETLRYTTKGPFSVTDDPIDDPAVRLNELENGGNVTEVLCVLPLQNAGRLLIRHRPAS